MGVLGLICSAIVFPQVGGDALSIQNHVDNCNKSLCFTMNELGAIDSAIVPIHSSFSVLEGMDTTVSPCSDFYQFANNGWRSKVDRDSTLSDLKVINNFSYVHDMMGKRLGEILDTARLTYADSEDPTIRVLGVFYESCMSADSLESVHFRRTSDTTVKDSTRGSQCLSRVISHLGGAAGQAFVKELVKEDVVNRMEKLLASIKDETKNRIARNTIMNDAEREYALERLDKLVLRIGIPDQLQDYSDLHLHPDSYEANKRLIAEFNNINWINSIGGNVRERWKASLLLVNAFYSPAEHAVEVPTIMFSPPFFFPDGEDLMNYAGVGYVIGHEIFHSVSMQLATIANPEMKSEIERFREFNTSLGELDGWKADGNRTFFEDVADLGGGRVAFDAWKSVSSIDNDSIIDGFNPQQRFFIALGKIWRSQWSNSGVRRGPHAAPFARVNGPVMQIPEFAESFGCKEGDRMYLSPDSMSRIW